MTAQMTTIFFRCMDEGTVEDYEFLHQPEQNYICGLPDQIMAALAPENHCQMAVTIIRPYVRTEVSWILEMQGLSQMCHYADKLGLNKNGRNACRGHKFFDTDVRSCEKRDQMSFDPDYPTRDLSYFDPITRDIFTRPPFVSCMLQEQG